MCVCVCFAAAAARIPGTLSRADYNCAFEIRISMRVASSLWQKVSLSAYINFAKIFHFSRSLRHNVYTRVYIYVCIYKFSFFLSFPPSRCIYNTLSTALIPLIFYKRDELLACVYSVVTSNIRTADKASSSMNSKVSSSLTTYSEP